MVDDRVRDGSRIGGLLSSEVHGHERGVMGRLSVVDADTGATPSEGGSFAYAVEYEPPDPSGEPRTIATASLHPERLRLDLSAAPETAIETAEREGLPASETGCSDADEQEVVTVDVESGAAVKPALRVLRAVAEALDDEVGEP